jgi:hypothetical protein
MHERRAHRDDGEPDREDRVKRAAPPASALHASNLRFRAEDASTKEVTDALWMTDRQSRGTN